GHVHRFEPAFGRGLAGLAEQAQCLPGVAPSVCGHSNAVEKHRLGECTVAKRPPDTWTQQGLELRSPVRREEHLLATHRALDATIETEIDLLQFVRTEPRRQLDVTLAFALSTQ